MAQVIVTKFFGPTNTKGSRIQVKSWLKTMYVSWDHSISSTQNHVEAARELVDFLNKERENGTWWISSSGYMPDQSGHAFVIELE